MRLDHPALPPVVSRPWLEAAIMVWLGVVASAQGVAGLAGVVVLVVFIAIRRSSVIALIMTVAVLGSLLTALPLIPVAPGPFQATLVMRTDAMAGRYGPWALADTGDGPLLLDLPEGTSAVVGQTVSVVGTGNGKVGVIEGQRHRGTVRVTRLEVVEESASPVLALGQSMRRGVMDHLQPLDDSRSLLAGFLIGETGGLDEIDVVAMRRAGLSHFTAVSGSNVALFLGLLAVAAGPLGVGPKRRAMVGLVALPIYAAATRFEPSVMRATVMAGVVLVGRLLGFALEAWQLLSVAVIGLLILDPGLAFDVGFQLSVAATAGVLVGARWPTDGARWRRALAVTIGAQVAVSPLLVLTFGRVPLLSPLVNLVAAPLVSAATVIGAVGVTGIDPLVSMAAWLAGIVLDLARGVSTWPQVGWVGLLVIGGMAALFIRFRSQRGALALVAALVLITNVIGPGSDVPEAGAVVLDVGQGDSILVSGGNGRFALVDGGPEAVRLIEKLGEYGVRRLELVVLSHVHADHATGLIGLVGRIPIGRVWAARQHHETPASIELFDRLAAGRVLVEEPAIGQLWDLGGVTLTVLGPLRRYASPNDESIVVQVNGPAKSMLLTGDIEKIAQADLGPLYADVLKVPHQGAATSDANWLRDVGADLAVISVGPNDYGHPAEWVISVLEDSEAVLKRTDRDGDVEVSLS
jgi:competence protein ComEC